MPSAGLKEFQRTLTSFKTLSALALKGVLAVPVVALIAKIGPPPTAAVASLTAIAVFVAIVWVFHFWYSLAKIRMNARMKIALVLTVVSLIGTGLMLKLFTTERPSDKERIVLGFTPLPSVKEVLSPTYALENALRDSGYKPESVYTSGSLAVSHALLLTTWLLTFGSLGTFLACFIVLQNRERRTPARR